ncbi:hypothetical protein GCM10010470_11850 [Saccharopolyspora taberi]|uniref:Uncharacterized protein n=1 Tax=Saccharopolyspora taberi TaxID=60895 RepID=A0ABN3V5Y2_9PSEU
MAKGNAIKQALGGGSEFLVDTSRNGNGAPADDAVCNPPGRRLGVPSQVGSAASAARGGSPVRTVPKGIWVALRRRTQGASRSSRTRVDGRLLARRDKGCPGRGPRPCWGSGGGRTGQIRGNRV